MCLYNLTPKMKGKKGRGAMNNGLGLVGSITKFWWPSPSVLTYVTMSIIFYFETVICTLKKLSYLSS